MEFIKDYKERKKFNLKLYEELKEKYPKMDTHFRIMVDSKYYVSSFIKPVTLPSIYSINNKKTFKESKYEKVVDFLKEVCEKEFPLNNLSIFSEFVDDVYHKFYDIKWEQQQKSREKSEKKLHSQGKEIVESLNIGDVALVKFKEYGMPTRGMLVMEIEDDFIGGFYLDRDVEVVPSDAKEEEGFIYSDPKKSYCWYNPLNYDDPNYNSKDSVRGKYKWDGKSFIKTRTYETKMIKFVKGKIENPVIKKK